MGGFESDLGNAIDFVLAVDHGANTPPGTRFRFKNAGGFAEINTAGQFPHHHNVYPFHHISLEGGGFNELGQNLGGAQIGKQPQTRSQPQQPPLRANLTGQGIPLIAPDRRQHNRIASPTGRQRFFRQGLSGGIDRTATNQRLGELKGHLQLPPHGLQHRHRHAGNFGTNAITGQQRNAIGASHSLSERNSVDGLQKVRHGKAPNPVPWRLESPSYDAVTTPALGNYLVMALNPPVQNPPWGDSVDETQIQSGVWSLGCQEKVAPPQWKEATTK